MPQCEQNRKDSTSPISDESFKLLIESKTELCSQLIEKIKLLITKSDRVKDKNSEIPNDDYKFPKNENESQKVGENEINPKLKFENFSSESSYLFKQMNLIIFFICLFLSILAFCTFRFYLVKSDLITQPKNIYNKTEKVSQVDSTYFQNYATLSKDSTKNWSKKLIINSALTQSNNKQCSINKLWINILVITLFFGSIITILILLLKRYKNLQHHLIENKNKDNELNRKLMYEKVKFYEAFLKSKLQNESIRFELYQRSKNEQINEIIRQNEHERKLDLKYYELESERLKKSYDFAAILKDFLNN